jgi:pyrroloquinoline quinone (PQQ) biosynthesis protein C
MSRASPLSRIGAFQATFSGDLQLYAIHVSSRTSFPFRTRVRSATESIVGARADHGALATKLAALGGSREESRPKMQRTVSAVLHCDIQTYANELGERSELMQRARSGRLGSTVVLHYLSDLRYLTEQTTRLLDLAASASAELGQVELAAHFRQKLSEETGHHVWAENDMAKLRRTFGSMPAPKASRALRELVEYLARTIERNPICYVGYALLAEYVTVAVGPAWLRALEENCGIGAEHLSVVANHIELDRLHVEEGLEEIRALAGAADLEAMRATISAAMRYFDAFLAELLALSEAA